MSRWHPLRVAYVATGDPCCPELMKWWLDPVMPFDPSPEVESLEAVIGDVPDQKRLSEIVKALGQAHPLLEGQQFLKRVKKESESGSWKVLVKIGSQIQDLGPDVESLVDRCGLVLSSALIPAAPPQTRAQFESASRLWPCRFHEDKRLEELLGRRVPDIWGEAAFETHRARMAAVLATQGESVLLVKQGQARQVELEPSSACTDHPVMAAIARLASEDSGQAGYLWSDCDVYLAREPCLMCSMALVHARVHQIFFGFPTPRGALQTLVRLHALQPLNHKFGVFRLRPEH
eukprot:maker-scaffold33_size549341-snap-gene-1.25 protein:Tk11530 transcript:maker-scaffold33_size549341-snap-gene-1.25-mRNA-1 annotation:"adenosine trna-specific 3 isoform 1"